MRHIVKLAKTQAFRIALAAVGLCVALGASQPAYATHFRYGNLTWQPVSGRTVNFNLTDAFPQLALMLPRLGHLLAEVLGVEHQAIEQKP